jgi:hypothetical protein
MTSIARKSIATVFAGTVLAVGIASPASAQTRQDGLVNVVVGDVTILEDVNIAAAVDAAVQACDLVDVGNVTLLAARTDNTSRSSTVCRQEDGDKVRFVQN